MLVYQRVLCLLLVFMLPEKRVTQEWLWSERMTSPIVGPALVTMSRHFLVHWE